MSGMALLLFKMPACPECGARTTAVRTDYLLFAGRPTGDDLYRLEPCGHSFEQRAQRAWVNALIRTHNKSTLLWLALWLVVLAGAVVGLALLLA